MSKTGVVEIRPRGKNISVPSYEIGQHNVIVAGQWLKMASLFDEELIEGPILQNAPAFVEELKSRNLGADIFTFSQRPPDTTPLHPYYYEWDNWAAIPITTFKEWWEDQLPQESRKNARRAAKRGVVVKAVPFDDKLIEGIHKIYMETPVRQGRLFWHYGKDLEGVRTINGTYLERSQFIGAYVDEELIGFIKFIETDKAAMLIQILAMNLHHDKRPINALLAYAVDLCEQRKMSYLVYGQYIYGSKQNSSLTEFKRRNGFVEIKFPRYYIPLTLKGKAALKTGLHLGVRNLLPPRIVDVLFKVRKEFWRYAGSSRKTAPVEIVES